ncbi:alanine:cation symporter family protein [Flavonifractor plautii]|nr:alanine:cation symporter family protein [Flavonifractor plautii]
MAQNHAGLPAPSEEAAGGRGLTQLQALSTALASTIGTGSIAGVATAIFYGGPGAVFWMWVSAFLGMMTGCVEKTLAVRYREKSRDGGWQGGPMCYMERGVGSRTLAALFSLCCVAASLGAEMWCKPTPSPPPWRRPSAGTGWRWDWWWPC